MAQFSQAKDMEAQHSALLADLVESVGEERAMESEIISEMMLK